MPQSRPPSVPDPDESAGRSSQQETDSANDARVIESWIRNAEPWTSAVREQRIESRKVVTDQAILDAVLSCAPRTVLDVGCGEGWLARALAAQGVHVTGLDVVPALIEQAKIAGGGEFRVASYDDIAAGRIRLSVDVVVCNFSLFGKASVEGIFRSAASLLTPSGSLLIQTLHPRVAGGAHADQDGWRAGTWAGFSAEFTDPAPWYFRTLESWIRLFADHGLRVRELREPLDPRSGEPASVLFKATVAL